MAVKIICLALLIAIFASADATIGAVCPTTPCDTSKHEICSGTVGDQECAADPCNPTNPCGDHGTCNTDSTAKVPTQTCTCKDGYGGAKCTVVPPCSQSKKCTDSTKPACKVDDGSPYECVIGTCPACEHGGVCTKKGVTLGCSCTTAYKGALCHDPSGGGHAVIDCDTNTSLCDATWQDCKKESASAPKKTCVAKACIADICQNGGTCDGTLPCKCPSGFEGHKCENGGNIVAATPALLMTLLLAVFFM